MRDANAVVPNMSLHAADDQYVPGEGAMVTALREERSLAAAGTVGGTWASLGPAPIERHEGDWWPNDTGRVLALAYSSSQGAIYAGTPGGGVWKTTDAGAIWTPVGDGFASPAVNALAIDPTNPNTIYAGTGEISGVGNSFRGVGMYKSTDGGATWTLLGDPLFNAHDISAIVIDPTDPNRIYAGVVRPQGIGNQGVAVSTDGGQTWTTTLQGSNVTDLAIDGGGHLYAAVQDQGVMYSANHGASWSNVAAGLPGKGAGPFKTLYRIVLSPNSEYTPHDGQILYAAVDDGAKDGPRAYRTVNGGVEWTEVAGPSTLPSTWCCGGQGVSHLAIGVDPGDPTGNTVYLGHVDLFKTTDALATTPHWTDLYTTTGPQGHGFHSDQYALLWVPAPGGSTLYVGNDGGVYRTTDGGATFSPANGNLAITEIRSGAIGPGSVPTLMLAGTQDNGVVLTTGAGWREVAGSDEFFVAIDPTNTDVMYSEFPFGKPLKTTTGFRAEAGTKAWDFATNGLPAPDQQGNIDNGLFDPPLVMDPTNPAVLYAGHAHLWKTSDRMNGWTNISSTVNTAGISALAVARSAPTTIYMGDVAGHLWTTTDGGSTWMSLDSPNCAPTVQSGRWCAQGKMLTALAVDPINSRIVYATLDGITPAFRGPAEGQKNHVFRSADGGATWQDISTSLPDMPFRSIAVDPARASTIFAGGAFGVYVSYDSGSSWHVLGTGLPNAYVYDVIPTDDGSHLFAFTYGRSVWRIDVPATPPPALTPTPSPPTPTLTSTPVSAAPLKSSSPATKCKKSKKSKKGKVPKGAKCRGPSSRPAPAIPAATATPIPTATAAPTSLPRLAPDSCSEEASLRSLNADTPTLLQFVNATSQTVDTYWLDYNGHRVSYGTLQPGASSLHETFVTHPWVVTNAAGTCLAIYLPTLSPSVAVVGG